MKNFSLNDILEKMSKLKIFLNAWQPLGHVVLEIFDFS